jgi:hypothetical protein
MVCNKHKIVFVHIPKTGGTSIEKFFGVDVIQTKNKLDPVRLVGHDRSTNEYLQHLPLQKIHQKCPDVIESNYFSFCFVRNPWSRFVSSFLYEQTLKKFKTEYDFKRFALKPGFANRQHSMQQSSFIVNTKNEIIIDFIGRFENLQEDFDVVCKKNGIPTKQLPAENSTISKRCYTKYYDDETRNIIANRFKQDIKMFGYKFGE